MDKENLDAKLKENNKQAGTKAQKTKEKLNEVFGKEKIKESLKKAKDGINKAVDNTKNSSIIKKMSSGQKIAALGVVAVIFITGIALLGRLMFTPDPTIWCTVDAPKSELTFSAAGIVADVVYSEKQVVPKGDTIARINDEAYVADFENATFKSMEANMKYLKMENRLADMENEFASLRLKSAESANEAAIVALEFAKAYEKQFHTFFENGEISETHFESIAKNRVNAETETKRAEIELENAKLFLEEVKKEHTPEEIENAKQEAKTAADQAAEAKKILDEATIIAPFDAYISKMMVKIGDNVEPGESACEVMDLSKNWLRGFVNKSLAESLKSGFVVTVEFQEIPGETFTGKIITIAYQSNQSKEGEALYEIRIELDNPSNSIIPGMEAIAIVASF
ncbi:MAG: efflux RND transporter periplasmic adaptor subunit [Synergistaceae bacterium]|nr:efflux RND transporter periplasmic adaptor subunit [Synergistaceae bacterium]